MSLFSRLYDQLGKARLAILQDQGQRLRRMVLILLSSIAPTSSRFPPPPSPNFCPLSPRTPFTPSPSFFAILSPIFTSSDDISTPTSPTLKILSPKNILPQTPPPWLLGPQSPASPLRPSPLRLASNTSKRLPDLPRLATENVPAPRRTQTYSRIRSDIPAGDGTDRRRNKIPPSQIKRIRTEPITRAYCQLQPSHVCTETYPPSPDARSIAVLPVPRLQVRPPSREIHEDTRGEALAEEGRRLSVAMIGVDVDMGNSVAAPLEEKDEEVMEVPIAIAIDQSALLEQQTGTLNDVGKLVQEKARRKTQRPKVGPLGRLASVLGR